MSYNITSLKVFHKNKNITKELSEDSLELIRSGYYPWHYNEEKDREKLSKKYGKILIKEVGDYGVVEEIWKNGKLINSEDL